ncbi:DUF1669 domain-containing protein [Chlamydia muridarum str. Nigg]|uniref:phospholipase D n=2 Tax=Chlamydia muridarum TaxID=83560 RepID=A0A070A3S2_CHLMR|nr:phospholipase D-like domain-containing protein [Chlamydia muridarum]AAF39301.1 phospholipase D family protein [Chlamydia muridarum str. Nigg]AHH22832.1 phospholipase [Chlamydia muridarum str. Nigg3 CMUT3-5]AHH23757.1 phospholipase [Chlamydia muridarum str. Nigg CM972]AID37968.1 phospholipase [Chlamydia muridarum str. Nigg 2 MCR]AIT90633.1 phospholipase [Chlamydia muridarum]
MTSPLSTAASSYLRTLQRAFPLGGGGYPTNPNSAQTALRVQTAATSLAIVPYPRPLSSEPVSFFSKHCKNDAQSIIENAILSASSSVFLKIFSLSSEPIVQDLICKSEESIPVTIHYQHIPEPIVNKLEEAGAELIRCHRNRRSLLHRKTMILDEKQVITGSANFTRNSINNDVNLLARVNNVHIANLMQKNQKGKAIIENSTKGKQTVCYLPINHKKCGNERQIVKAINNATSSIQIGMCILTHRGILQALNEAATQRSVLVTIIIDSLESQQTIDILKALGSKLRVRVGTGDRIHCKACILDHNTAIIGSANWAASGLKANKEDIIIVNPLTERQREDLSIWWRYLCDNSAILPED